MRSGKCIYIGIPGIYPSVLKSVSPQQMFDELAQSE